MEIQASAEAGSTLNAERLKYVTEHFHALQGLTWVAFGAMLLIPSMMDFYGLRWPTLGWVALLISWPFAFRYIPKYYRRRFGWVELGPASMTNRQAVIFLLVFLVLLFFGRPIGRYADLIYAVVESMISEPAHPVTLLPVLLWFVYFCASLRRHPSQEDRYRTCFFSLGMLAWAFVVLSPLWHPEITHFKLWEFLKAGWLGISLISVGLYDHITLVRLLPKRIEEDGAGKDDNER